MPESPEVVQYIWNTEHNAACVFHRCSGPAGAERTHVDMMHDHGAVQRLRETRRSLEGIGGESPIVTDCHGG